MYSYTYKVNTDDFPINRLERETTFFCVLLLLKSYIKSAQLHVLITISLYLQFWFFIRYNNKSVNRNFALLLIQKQNSNKLENIIGFNLAKHKSDLK
jgi:hypothetical protein